MNLDFLKDVTLKESDVKVRATRAKLNTTPVEGANLRLFSDGRIFPSQELVTMYNLEYVAKGEDVGNGFDIIDTDNSPHYPEGQQRIVMVSLTPKDSSKVDLFGSVGYNEDGSIKKSVMDQGSTTTGKWLVALLLDVYAEELFVGDTNFVDLQIHTDMSLNTTNDIYHMPKTVTRGEKKGEVSYVRRTNTTLWPLTVFTANETLEEDIAVENDVKEEVETTTL
jgi:5-hydroxyisourate hydrolase-like protein (transthyretin family)